MIRLADLKLFTRTSALGSFSNAAREANISPAQVSAAIKRLETVLCVRLFTRSTRNLRLTQEGKTFLAYAENVLSTLQNGIEMVRHQFNSDRKGTLQISAPSDFGRNILTPWLHTFRESYPDLSLKIQLSDQITNVFDSPVDIALRYGRIEDSSVIALPLAPWNRSVLVASPDYLSQHSALNHPFDLKKHNCLMYIINDRIFNEWYFSKSGEVLKVKVEGLHVCDDAELVHRWALAGEGIAYKSWLDVSDDLKKGTLIHILPHWHGRNVQLNLICPHRHQITPFIRQLYEFLKMKCSVAKQAFESQYYPV